MTTPRLVLWDIDRTLMYVGHIDKRLYFEIFEEILGYPIDALADTTGRTDPSIFRDTFLQHGIAEHETETLVPRYIDRLAERFADARADIHRDGQLFDGTVDTLKTVNAQPGIIASVLTGNIKPVAVAKLEFFDLHPYVDTHIGAYGSDDPDKATLVTIAQQRAAAKHGHTFDRSDTVLIGDSPHDVDAGRHGGATTIAVATGKHTAAELRDAGADTVLDDLRDTDTVLKVIHSF